MPNIKTQKKKRKLFNRRQQINKNRSRKIVRKLNVILDIDETLLQMGSFDDLHQLTKGPHNVKLLKNNYGLLVFLRPNVNEFLDYLFKNFNVGFWTNASTDIANDYLDALLTPKQKKQINLFIARDQEKNNYYDFLAKTNFKLHSQKRNVKKLSYLFNSPIYKSNFTSKNTLLIDDNPTHYAINRGKNVIFINEFHKLRYCDDTLSDIIMELSKINKRKTVNLNQMKLPNYASINTNFDSFNIFNSLFMNINMDECQEYQSESGSESESESENNSN